MKDKITIGELAKLVGTSTYNIRYYEKEGLISTPEIGENGYRLYGHKEFYELSTIMLFRDVNFPIKKIKELQADFELEKYKNALNESYDKLTVEIDRLIKLKDKIKYKKEILLKYEEKLEKFEVKQFKKRLIYHLKITDYDSSPTLKELYDILEKNNMHIKNGYENEEYYILKDDVLVYGLCNNEIDYDIKNTVFNEGNYLCYSFFIKNDSEYEKHINKMIKYITKNKIKHEGELILRINPSNIIYNDEKYIAELEIKIK